MRDVECLARTQKRLILLAFVSYEAACLWWRGGSNGVVEIAIPVRFRPPPPSPDPLWVNDLEKGLESTQVNPQADSPLLPLSCLCGVMRRRVANATSANAG